MAQSTGKVTLALVSADGSTTNVTADLANIVGSGGPPPPVVPPVVPPAANEPVIPATATVIDLLPAVTPWKMNHDAGTPGSSSGTTVYPFTAPDGSTVRQFKMTLVSKGGEIYHVRVLDDATAFSNFCFEKVEASADWSGVGQAETDLEKTLGDGSVEDMAMQQSMNGGEEITINGHWTPTGIKIDPSIRAPNVLHTTRNYVTLNADKTIAYHGVFFDGTYYSIEQTATDQQSKPWAKNILNLQLQYDGKNSASTDVEVWMHTLRVHAW